MLWRRIRRAFLVHPDRLFRTTELAAWVYPRLAGKPQRKHRWAICRAARRVATRVRRDRPGGVVFRPTPDIYNLQVGSPRQPNAD